MKARDAGDGAWHRRSASVRARTQDVVGAVGEGAPIFVAGDQPVVAVAAARQERAATSEPAAGSEKAKAPSFSPRAMAREEAPLLLLAEAVQADERPDDRADAHPGAAQFLGDEAIFEAAEAEPAMVFRNEDGEEAELGEAVADRHRDVALLRVEPVGGGQHLGHREVAGGLADEELLFGEHGGGQVRAGGRQVGRIPSDGDRPPAQGPSRRPAEP